MKQFLLLVLITSLFMSGTLAQNPLRKIHFNTEKSLAIQGYDPVAYFTQNKAVKGNKQFAANADGIIYYFSSAANKDLFVKDYSKYEP
jgi:YHS domain-containing protein